MVQLFPPADLDVGPPCEGLPEKTEENGFVDSPKRDSSGGPTFQPLNLEASRVYQGYDGYIENGLICLRHKVRNLEKKKVRDEEPVVFRGLQPVAEFALAAETRRL